MYSLSLRVFTIVLLLRGLALALPHTLDNVKTIKTPAIELVRSADTCADPSLAQPLYQSFRADLTAHLLNYRQAFEHDNTRNQASVWADLQPSFRAWPTQQNFTVPLFQLGAADRMQYIYRTGVDATTPPVVSGFNTDVALLAWVYDSPVCGSVPLMSTVWAQMTDHYFTTSAFEHDWLVAIAAGWTDSGVVAYVLPFYDS